MCARLIPDPGFGLGKPVLDPKRGIMDAPPVHCNFFHFHVAFGKKLPNYSLAPHLGVDTQSGQSWIRHCMPMKLPTDRALRYQRNFTNLYYSHSQLHWMNLCCVILNRICSWRPLWEILDPPLSKFWVLKTCVGRFLLGRWKWDDWYIEKNVFIISMMCLIEMSKLFSRTHLTVYVKWNIVIYFIVSSHLEKIKSETAMFRNPRLKPVSHVYRIIQQNVFCFYFTLLYKYFMNFANENVVLFYIYFPSRLLLIHSGLAKITWLLFALRGQIYPTMETQIEG